MEMFHKIVELLNRHQITFRVHEHPAEGRCEEVSKIRGNSMNQSLKALVVMAKLNNKDRKYYLAVLPADRPLNMNAIAAHAQALNGAMLAPADRAKNLSGCEMGAVLPFSFHSDLHILADPSIKENQEIAFNAGVLDRSIFMDINDYIKAANPTFVKIAKEI